MDFIVAATPMRTTHTKRSRIMDPCLSVTRYRGAVGAAAFYTMLGAAVLACSAAPAQNAPPPRATSGEAAKNDQAGPPDSVDLALDRIDAARARLETADAAVASALQALDAALDGATRLGPAAREHALSSSADQLERESDRMSARWADEGRRWQGYGERWAGFGQRIAERAERLARRQAMVAEREAEYEVDRDIGDTHDDEHEGHARHHHAGDRCGASDDD
jgi:hypothetical protein